MQTSTKKIDNQKISKNAFGFDSYLDDYFGLIILISVLAVFIGLFFFVWYPRLTVAMSAIRDIGIQLDEEKGELEKYKNSIIKYKNAYNSISSIDKSKVNEMIGPWNKYPSLYVTDLLITFQTLLKEENYLLKSVSVDDYAPVAKNVRKKKTAKIVTNLKDDDLPQSITEIKVQLEFEKVNYEELKEILSLLEKKLRLADVSSINFSPESETCSIELATYRFDEGI